MLETLSQVQDKFLTDTYVDPTRSDVETAAKACERIHENLQILRTPIRWKIRQDAIETAKQLIGIKWKTEINITNFDEIGGTNGSCGIYYIEPGGESKLHYIRILECLHPIDASIAIWHELRHAAQAEFIGKLEFLSRYRLEMERFGINTWQQYIKNPFEEEAYATEIYHFDICQLTQEI